ncbi:MAG TPA: hypothetical protein PLQ35_17130 [bacterium]|nr:hypothetical protein [bacterium]HQL64002.1 hypothetical protein [bacterium]
MNKSLAFLSYAVLWVAIPALADINPNLYREPVHGIVRSVTTETVKLAPDGAEIPLTKPENDGRA